MKIKGYGLAAMISVAVLLMSLIFSSGFAHAQESVRYLGDLSWQMHRQDKQPAILQLGFTTCGGHFPVSGKIKYQGSDSPDDVWYSIVHGNAELIDNRLEIVLHGAEVDPTIVSFVVYIFVSLSDLNGTYQMVCYEDTGPVVKQDALTFGGW